MPSKEAAQLQHSREFVEKEDPTIVRQTTVAKGDSYILGEQRTLTLT